ncbi:MAG: helix-hairpin-helix domain-containing protein [Gemmatimonas sp.]
MPTAAERQALAFLAGVALLGGGARVWMQHRDDSFMQRQSSINVSAETVEGQLSAIDSAKASRRGKKRDTKSSRTSTSPSSPRAVLPSPRDDDPPQVLDVDVASAEELERLPRVGPALAARIVANRDSFGAFGSLQALGEVRGIGAALLKVLSPAITFSARPRPSKPKAAPTKRRRP